MKHSLVDNPYAPLSDRLEISSIAVINGSAIYKKSGSGPPLVFFHGWIGNEDTFSPCHAAFARHYTVYRPAWPGYGNSSPLTDLSIEDFVEIGKKFILSMGHTSVTLVGNCLGGNVAMELVRLYPGMVERLYSLKCMPNFSGTCMCFSYPASTRSSSGWFSRPALASTS